MNDSLNRILSHDANRLRSDKWKLSPVIQGVMRKVAVAYVVASLRCILFLTRQRTVSREDIFTA